MALIVEDGSNVPDANSYTDVYTLRLYCKERGNDLPESDEVCETLLIRAMDYLQSLEPKFKGRRVSMEQRLSWPRDDVRGHPWPDVIQNNYMPYELITAQCALAVEALEHDLMPTRLAGPQQGPIVKEKVEGAVETVYANPGKEKMVDAFSKADAQLQGLLKRGGLFMVRA
ncbi:DnaT-like ssDNA-binding protein [Photobacterium sp. 1_MG-2023]|uniref:DnaT-like ssDNA-binding protein n=1 Tax=Photobacterium sp. 1_MG-2023 TaxID=3062646 RepID=UPI0026E276AF|nr:DnaT-like ssDNA-binding protein [Photobacterium sp. 1_MG-2023]MDO6706786.1 hypothetical protein [Photobacterium sp. 1_MG-2023]